jgi:hypothetical protein
MIKNAMKKSTLKENRITSKWGIKWSGNAKL